MKIIAMSLSRYKMSFSATLMYVCGYIRYSGYKLLYVYIHSMQVDVDAKRIAAESQECRNYTTLIRHLVGRCTSDIEKARAIFRYNITQQVAKRHTRYRRNFKSQLANNIFIYRFMTERKFNHQSWFLYYPEEGNTRGAPTQLLRGVEFGIETKALLFKRLCSYAGLHCEVHPYT